MHPQRLSLQSRRGHTLIELITAMASSAMLLAGLGSVMLIASQVANTPMAATQRLEAANAVNELSNDVRFATFIVERSASVLDFVVADRTNDGTAERIRYDLFVESDGTKSLRKAVNGGTPMRLVEKVQVFDLALTTRSKVESFVATTESAEAQLAGNTSGSSNFERDINYPDAIPDETHGQFSAQRIDPTAFTVPGGATSWNLTRVDFQARRSSSGITENLRLQVRPSGDPSYRPTSELLGEIVIPESTLPASTGWHTSTPATPLRGLALHRRYNLIWAGTANEAGNAAWLLGYDVAGSNARHVNESNDGGTSWQTIPGRRIYYRLWGTFNSPGATINVTRNYATRLNVELRCSDAAHSRVNTSVPLANAPELLSAYWRTDFDRDPTTDDVTRDGTLDWTTSGGGPFSGAAGGIWTALGAIESRPKNNFTAVTTIAARCRNTGTGGNGAVIRAQVDRQGGVHAPLEIRVQKQADLSQTVSLYGKSDDATEVLLFQRKNLSSDFVRLRLTILPANNVVNIAINNVDEGTYTYPTYAPLNDNRFLTAYADTSSAEFDYVEMRVAE